MLVFGKVCDFGCLERSFAPLAGSEGTEGHGQDLVAGVRSTNSCGVIQRQIPALPVVFTVRR
jgi:hypothetical protein